LDRFADDQEVCGELEITLADCDAMRCAVMDEVGRQAGDWNPSDLWGCSTVQCRVPIIFLAHFARITRLTVLAHPFCTTEPSRCQIPSICPGRNNYYSNFGKLLL
jgi:hypothetical protein